MKEPETNKILKEIEQNTEMSLVQSEKIASSVDGLEPALEGILLNTKPKEVQKMELMGAEIVTIKGEKGDKPTKGEDYMTPEEIEDFVQKVQERIIVPRDGADGYTPLKGEDYYTDAEIKEVLDYVVSKIPAPIPGKDAVVDYDKVLLDVLSQLPEPKKGDKGERGESGSPDTGKQIKEKLEALPEDEGLDYNKLSNKPDFQQFIANALRAHHQSSKTVSLRELDDVDLTGLSIVNGKYVLGSGSGGGGTLAATLLLGNTTGGRNIIMSAGDVIKSPSATGTSLILTDAFFTISTDNGNYNTPYITGGPTALSFASLGSSQIDMDATSIHLNHASLIQFSIAAVRFNALTATTVPYLNASKNLVSSAITPTELGYLSGVSSAIQTQLNAKQATLVSATNIKTINGNSLLGAGDLVVGGGSGDVTKVGTPVNNQVGVWTGDGTIEGDADLTFDTATNTLTTGLIVATTVTANLTGNVTGNVSGTAATVTGAAQTAITSLGTLTALDVDNININGNTISSTAGTDLLITPLAGQQLVLDGTIEIDAGVVTGATSITSTVFVGALTGNASTATALANARTIGGVSFDGTANITVATATGGFTVSGGSLALGTNSITMSGSIGVTGTRVTKGWFTDLEVTNAIVGAVTGNAGTATALQNARTIGGVSFDGTANITVATATGGFTISGGNLALGTNSLTMTGSIAATGSRVTKLWATDIESTNMPTVGGTAILTSLTAPQFTTIELGHASDTTLSRSAAGVLAVEGVVIPSISSSNTITNKRNQPRVVSAASYTTDTGTSLDVSTCDDFIITAQAGALLFNSPSGTPVQGEKLVIRIKDNGTARALTWNAVFRAVGVALPTTTVLSKTLYLGFKYNSTDTKWDLIASTQEA